MTKIKFILMTYELKHKERNQKVAFFCLDETRELGSETFGDCFRSHSCLAGDSRPEPQDLVLDLGSWETPVT